MFLSMTLALYISASGAIPVVDPAVRLATFVPCPILSSGSEISAEYPLSILTKDSRPFTLVPNFTESISTPVSIIPIFMFRPLISRLSCKNLATVEY